jgi:hypothetical protein
VNNSYLQELANDQYARNQWGFLLPLSLNADSVTYVLDFETRVDTCTVFYKRKFFYKDKCGFVFDIERTNTVNSRTTFQDVQVTYQSYIPRGGGVLWPKATGLQVIARL